MAKILLIEDLSDNANLARKIFTAKGYEFFWAETAELGLQMALAHQPDLILLDLGLPDMDGQTLALLLREEPTLQHVPLIAMTAWPEDGAVKIMEAYQLDGYIGKPISIQPFLKKIEGLKMNDQNVPLVPASKFSLDELVAFYNETRTDYMVPMPMNSLRMEEYIRDYDVDLTRSVVAMRSGRLMGLGMLGLRAGHAWITRLGVLPLNRRRGIGEAMIASMINTAKFLDVQKISAEVILGNQPARGLLMKYGFKEGKEYLILRRPPKPVTEVPIGEAQWLEKEEALTCLQSLGDESWINSKESMANAPTLRGLRLVLPDGSCGWVVFKLKMLQLTNILLHTEQGEPRRVGRQLLLHLHHQHKRMDTQAENIHIHNTHLSAFYSLGYFEAFRRIEMTQIV